MVDSKADASGKLLGGAAVAIAFAGTMIAMWSFSHARLAWGAFNLALVMVALAVVVAVRGRRG